jgi:hypothetical protein
MTRDPLARLEPVVFAAALGFAVLLTAAAAVKDFLFRRR